MSHTDQAVQDGDADMPAGRRISFERLRERTDELELLISGLLAFALLTLPPRLFEAWVGSELHAEGATWYVLQFAFNIGVGLSYALGFAFLVHLAIRGYWVGLVGLKSHFPGGIRWERLSAMGPVSRRFYRGAIGDLGQVIDRVDRTASVLFATTVLVALTLAWIGVLGLGLLIPATLIGLLFEDSERATFIAFAVPYVAFLLGGMAIFVLDKLVARRAQHDQPAQGLERAMDRLLRVFSTIALQRLGGPVQFTLQSNLGNRGFSAVYFLVLSAAMVIGGMQIVSSASFSLLSRYRVVTSEAVDHGMLSAHYESMRGPDDVMLRYPMIPSDRIEEGRLRVFIPHRPRLDNPRAEQACPTLVHGRNAAQGRAAADQAVACLAKIWTVTLDGRPVALTDFVPMERRDLGMRGLVGYLDLQGETPGRHDLRLLWNAGGGERGVQRQRDYFIPFWYDPQDAPPPAAKAADA